MKDLIVTIGILILLLTFPLQYAVQEHNHHVKSKFQVIVSNSKEEAKAQGYFTPKIIKNMKESILTSFPSIEEDDIIIDVTTKPKYRVSRFDERELIHYRVGIPIEKILASPSFWGVSDDDNKHMYIIDRVASSEKIFK